MTDKQIIIDYKNLCENYSKEVGCYNTFDGSCIKEQCFTYRLLQLLQAKEQECESLNKRAASLEEIADDLQQRNHHLTQECEELKDYARRQENQRETYYKEFLKKAKVLEEIEQELKEDIYCESQECGCDDFEECLRCTKEHILDIINKVKDGKECQN